MKPRIRLRRSIFGAPYWVCEGPLLNGVGDTPAQAFKDRQVKVRQYNKRNTDWLGTLHRPPPFFPFVS